MPWASKTLSSAAAWSSQPSSYDMPEQPPPTTRIRRPHSGLPSSRRSSETFFAAVSVIVTIAILPIYQAFPDSTRFEVIVSQDGARRRQRMPPLGRHRMPPEGNRVSSSSEAPGGSEAMSTAARATSAGLSIRPRSGEFGIVSQRGVSTAPGTSTPTRTPSARSSSASTRLKPTTRPPRPVWSASAGNRPLGGHRRDIDDGAPALTDHDRKHGAAGHHHRAQIDREHPVPVGRLGAGDGAERGDSGRGDEHVDAPELGDGLLNHRLDGGVLRDVGWNGERRPPALADGRGRRRQLLACASREHDRGVLPREGRGDRVADPAAGAGDDRDLALQGAPAAQIWSPRLDLIRSMNSARV